MVCVGGDPVRILSKQHSDPDDEESVFELIASEIAEALAQQRIVSSDTLNPNSAHYWLLAFLSESKKRLPSWEDNGPPAIVWLLVADLVPEIEDRQANPSPLGHQNNNLSNIISVERLARYTHTHLKHFRINYE